MIRIGVLGANGRMGQTLLSSVASMKDIVLAVALVRPGHDYDARSVATEAAHGRELYYTSDWQEGYTQSDVLIDFTLPEATQQSLEKALDYETSMVIGTTGLTHEHHHLMERLSHKVPVLYDTNMSIGVALLNRLVEQTARALGSDFDCEITEMHHRHKKDLPSGTAVTLAKYAARGYEHDLEDVGTLRSGQTSGQALQISRERQSGEIGLSAMRGGGVYGDHSVVFASEEEIVTLSHRALNREVFAKGALIAARWLTTQAPGLYSMRDLLGIC